MSEELQRKIFLQPRKLKGEVIAPVVYQLSKKFLGQKILDIGAGEGQMVELLKKKGRDTYGIDLVPYPEKGIKYGNITKLTFPDESFHSVICMDVLEHLDNNELKKGLQEAHRILKKNGTIIITSRYRENLVSSMIICPYCSKRFHRFGHEQSFNEDRLKEVLPSQKWQKEKFFVSNFYFLSRMPFSLWWSRFALRLFDPHQAYKDFLLILRKK